MMKPGDIFDADDVPDGTLVCDGERPRTPANARQWPPLAGSRRARHGGARMTPDDKITMMKALFRDFGASGDASHLIDRLTDDAVYHLTVGPGTPLSGRWVGKAGVTRYFATMHAALRHESLNVYDFFANEDKVVVTGDETLYIHRNGVTFFTEWALVVRFRGDQIDDVLVIENLGPLSAAYADAGEPDGATRTSD